MDFIPNTDRDREIMLAELGLKSVEDLFAAIPSGLRSSGLEVGEPLSEMETSAHLARLAGLNAADLTCFTGAGFYDHFIPAAVDALISRGEFYTAYTPYQAEMSQGTLQSIYEYQTSISRLTGMEASNASLYDGGTALFEAAMLAVRKTRKKKLIVCTSVNPIYRAMLRSYTVNLSLDLVETDLESVDDLKGLIDKETAAVIIQYPDFFGRVFDPAPYFACAAENKALSIAVCYPLALALLKTPAEAGAEIVVGEAQSLGLPLSFGGPYLGYMAVSKKFVRAMPGRVAGKTVDHDGKVGYCLTLQTREQHIRREKATSNICSNEALCALIALVYMSLLGKEGMREVAELNLAKAAYARERLTAVPGVGLVDEGPWFNEFRLKLPVDAGAVVGRLLEKGLAAGFPLGRYYPDQSHNLLLAVTEKRTREEIDLLAQGLEAVL